MKKVILLFLSCFYLLSGFSQQKSKDVTILCWGTDYSSYPEFLNGKVKEIINNSYWAIEKNGQVEKGALLTLKDHNDQSLLSDFHAFYNNSGVLLRHDYLGDNSKIQWSHVNEITTGRVTKENWVRNDSVIGYALFHYNKNGFITDVPMHSSVPDSSNGKLVLTCDEKGHMTKMLYFNSRDILLNRSEYKWNEAGRMIHSEDFMANDSLQSKLDIVYNDHGFYDQIKYLDGKGKIIFEGSVSYKYDEKGNWIKAVWSKAGKPWIIVERTYKYF